MMVTVKRRQEYFMRSGYTLFDVSPSGLFGIMPWPNCHVFRNMRSFMNVVKKNCVLMKELRKDSSEIHMAGFCGGFLYTNVCGCIFVCINARDCRQSRVK